MQAPNQSLLSCVHLPMQITSFNETPIASKPYLDAGHNGPTQKDLPIFVATVDSLPSGTEAIIATADLQGRGLFDESTGQGLPLIGEILPRWLAEEILPGLGLPNSDKIGEWLCGDFYTDPTLAKRGASGDVTEVWREFRSCFAWLAGVPGNHDTFGDSESGKGKFSRGQRTYYLDGNTLDAHGLKMAGLGGIISGKRLMHRRRVEDYLRELAELLQLGPSVLLTHDGPEAGPGCRGSSEVRQTIEQHRPTLIVRGHAHWRTRLVTLANGQVELQSTLR